MKKITIIIITLLFVSQIFGQNISADTTFAKQYYALGDKYYDNSNLDSSSVFYQKAADIYKQIAITNNDTLMWEKYVGCLYDVSWNLSSQYKFINSINVLDTAIIICLKYFGENHKQTTKIYDGYANLYSDKHEFDLALHYYLKSLKIKKIIFGEKHISLAIYYSNIATIYSIKNEYNLAHQYYFKALQISKNKFGEEHYYVTSICNNIGIVYWYKNEYDLALQYYFKALQINKKLFGEKHTFIINNYNNIGNVYNDKNKFDLALQYYFKSLHIIEELYEKNHSYLAVCYNNIGNVYNNRNEYDLALQYYFNSLQIFTELLGHKHIDVASIYINIGHVYATQNKYDLALQNYQKAIASSLRNFNDTINIYSVPEIKDYLNWNNLLNALQAKAEIFATKNLVDIENSQSLALQHYQACDTLITKTRQEIITIFAISKKDFVVTQVSIVETLHARSLQEAISDYRFYISETDLFVDEILWGTHWSVTEYEKFAFQFYNLLFPPEIQEFLKGGIFYDIENLLIIPDGQLATIPFETLHTQKYSGEWTDWKSKTYFAEMPYLIKDYNISYNYSATLFQQTKPKERTDEIEITHLNDWIAFAPVFDDENTSGTTTRTRELLTYETMKNDSIVSRSYLTDGRYVSPLPGSKTEIETIFDLYEQQGKKALIKTHQQANETFVKSDELQNYRIIHFATHGFVNEGNPKFSGILFAQDTTVIIDSLTHLPHLIAQQNEGILYQSEIYNLNFNADLVVLSACETGLGKITEGEGVIGLTRALLYAGSKNIIVSLWSVNDKSTSKLMINFYENLLNSPLKAGKGDLKQDKFAKHLSEAKRKMIEDGKYSHPYFWSPFILIGE